MNMKTVVTWIR